MPLLMGRSLRAVPLCGIGVFIYLRAVYSLREATSADAERLARMVAEGMEYYRSFTPPGWTPPGIDDPPELGDDAVCLVAEDDAGLAGQVTVLPASGSGRPVDDPGLAHLSNLFVRQDEWGTGLAVTLHGAALQAARERGYTAIRLFVAAGQARARRFYEREGWAVEGDEFHEARLGLDMVEYRHAL
jgi:GNAT superfamily N-acetyltransferase